MFTADVGTERYYRKNIDALPLRPKMPVVYAIKVNAFIDPCIEPVA